MHSQFTVLCLSHGCLLEVKDFPSFYNYYSQGKYATPDAIPRIFGHEGI